MGPISHILEENMKLQTKTNNQNPDLHATFVPRDATLEDTMRAIANNLATLCVFADKYYQMDIDADTGAR